MCQRAMKTAGILLVMSLIVENALSQPIQPEVLHHFTRGEHPVAPLVLAPDGNIYGTSPGGGINGYGTVFRLTPGGQVSTVVNFTGPGGRTPGLAALIAGAGELFGLASYGGNGGRGTLYRLSFGGELSPLAHFGDNASPLNFTRDGQGNFYVTIVKGLISEGSIFRLRADGSSGTVAVFPQGYGSFPAALTAGSDGNIYGRTYNGVSRVGTVFQMTPTGSIQTMATLDGCSHAASTALTEGHDGSLYGTTDRGGTHGRGTVFRISQAGPVTTLVEFDETNGSLPFGPLTLGGDGNLYGATVYGGAFEGTVYRLNLRGALTTLAHFTSRISGVRPYGGVIFGADGALYGTTATGGSGDSGIIFRVGLPPDSDGDGVVDAADACPGSAPGAIVNEDGCAVDQLAPCNGPWRNHGQYVVAFAAKAAQFVSEGLIGEEEAEALVAAAVHSDCGKQTPRRPHGSAGL